MNQDELKRLIQQYREATEKLQAFIAICQYLALFIFGFQCPFGSSSSSEPTTLEMDGYVDQWEQEYAQ